MKLLFCQDCGDIIAPSPKDLDPRWCICRRHAVWWLDGATGVLRVHDASAAQREEAERALGMKPVALGPSHRAYVIGLTNILLRAPESPSMSAELVQQMIDAHEDHYLFKRWHSLVIRFRPGESGDTAWSELPVTSRYTFPPNPRKPGYLNVLAPGGELVGELWYEDHGIVVCQIYENMRRQNERRANEFMYGHMMGMAMALAHADRYPKITHWRRDDGELMMRYVDPVTGETWEGPALEHPDSARHVQTALRKGFSRDDA